MSADTKIEWCDATWSPWLGCTKIAPACDHCYAASWAKRTGSPELWAGERRRTSTDYWKRPLKWNREAEKAGTRKSVFPSLCDPFDNQVPNEWRRDFFDLIEATPHLLWLLLTKRPQNILRMVPLDWLHSWPENVWPGTTVEDRKRAGRNLWELAQVHSRVRFMSAEPLLEGFDLTAIENPHGETFNALTGFVNDDIGWVQAIDWVICGGESGPNARPMHPDWARDLRDQCAEHRVPFFFKQHGEWIGVPDLRHLPGGSGPGIGAFDHCEYDQEHEAVRIGKARAGRLLDGVEHSAVPDVLARAAA
ncbi:phage Gp37/Gp68 family protein [Afifella aestuarii]|uniref:phage Gp37/Gp68 family protein n=1 Tax=Afifella aestuarii TaxID=1909496 RepID=UPI000FE3A4A7|nr:phage Gp37/Gp68 family protein [Afifella aestuarii]